MLAHQTAAFFGAAQAGKLKEASHYLSKKTPSKRQSADDILSGFDRHMKAVEGFKNGRNVR